MLRALQVQAFVRGNAVAGVVQAALESEGTPNELVQTDLTEARVSQSLRVSGNSGVRVSGQPLERLAIPP